MMDHEKREEGIIDDAKGAAEDLGDYLEEKLDDAKEIAEDLQEDLERRWDDVKDDARDIVKDAHEEVDSFMKRNGKTMAAIIVIVFLGTILGVILCNLK